MKWEELRLGDVIHIKHGWAFKGEYFSDSGDFILLTPGNVYEEGGLKLKGDKEKYYTGDFPEEYLLKYGYLLVVMTDLKQTAPILGASLIIPEDRRFLHNQRLGLVQIKDETRIDYKFLYYVFNSPIYRGKIRGTATGATVRHTAPERIYACVVPCPSNIEEQKRIADILSKYDDLIDNNNRRIALLEESVHLLYREWFVSLRFPGHESVRVVDGVPKGWELRPLSKCVNTQYGYTESASHFKIGPQYLRGTDINKKSYIDWSTVPYCQIEYSEYKKFALQKNDIVMIRMADPGKVAIIEREIDAVFASYLVRLTIRDCIILEPYYLFYFLNSDWYQAFISGASTGSTRKSASAKLMTNVDIPIPPLNLQKNFSKNVSIFPSQITTLLIQNQKLKEARDSLLPRLMNGSLEV